MPLLLGSGLIILEIPICEVHIYDELCKVANECYRGLPEQVVCIYSIIKLDSFISHYSLILSSIYQTNLWMRVCFQASNSHIICP